MTTLKTGLNKPYCCCTVV